MATQVRMPQLGESVTEGTVVHWLKQPGEHVALDESLAEIETEKVNVEIPSPFEGTLARLLVPEGQTVDVGTPIAEIEEVGTLQPASVPAAAAGAAQPIAQPEATAAGSPPARADASTPQPVTAGRVAPAFEATGPLGPAALAHGMFSTAGGESAPAMQPREQARAAQPDDGLPGPAGSANGHQEIAPTEDRSGRYSPAVLRLAHEHGVDLSRVRGSGLGGRITRKDVQSWIDAGGAAPAQSRQAEAAEEPLLAPTMAQPVAPPDSATVQEVQRAFEEQPSGRALSAAPAVAMEPPAVAEPAPTPSLQASSLDAGEELEPLSATRRAIARHMVRSVQTAPHAWMVVEVDVSPLVAYREAVKEEFRRRGGVELSYLPFMIKATVAALKQHPRLNSSWSDEGVVLKKRINIGIAVSTDQGLVVPVIHDADDYSIAGLAKQLADLVDRARARRLRLEDIDGGTFTVDNVGPLGSVVSQPIINQPQCAIVTMESIVKRPVVVGDAIAIRSMLNCCISFDHRIVDGGDVGPFMKALKSNLEAMGAGTPMY